MRKIDELTSPKSCLNKAKSEEMCFVLLARDPVAPEIIRKWVNTRIRVGLNKPGDAKMAEALKCAEIMEVEGGET